MTGLPASSHPKPKGHVLAVLPRGEAIRNFAYSGVLSELACEHRVSLASVVPDEELIEGFRAEFEVHEIATTQERLPVRLARTLLDQAHGRWLWSEAAQERWRRRDQEAATVVERARRSVWKVAGRALASDRGVVLASRVERAASKRFSPRPDPGDLITSLDPDLVFNGSHIHAEPAVPLVQAARWAGATTAAFLFSWDNLTSQGRLLDIYDHFLAWNDDIANHLLAMYPSTPRDHVHITGTPQFDFHFRPEYRWERAQWAEVVGVDPDRSVVLYTTGMPNHMPGEPEIVEGLADSLAKLGTGAPQLLVRVYAKDRSGRFEDMRSRRPDIAFSPVPWLASHLTPLPADLSLWSSTLAHVSCGVNVASTVSLELAMFDVPAVNVAFNPRSVKRSTIDYARYYRFDHYAPVVASGAVELGTSDDDLAERVVASLRDPGRRHDARKQILDQMFGGTLDGRSSHRVAQVLSNLAAEAAR